MQAWLIRSAKADGVPVETMIDLVENCLEFPSQKPAAFLTIDDRCICFTGHFPNIGEIEAFEPWHKENG